MGGERAWRQAFEEAFEGTGRSHFVQEVGLFFAMAEGKHNYESVGAGD